MQKIAGIGGSGFKDSLVSITASGMYCKTCSKQLTTYNLSFHLLKVLVESTA